MITWMQFEAIDMRVGTIISAFSFPEAHKPAYRMIIDFGPLGTKQSSAQITEHYSLDELIGMQVCAVVNFPPKKIGPWISEVLVMGVLGDGVVLISPKQQVSNGMRIG